MCGSCLLCIDFSQIPSIRLMAWKMYANDLSGYKVSLDMASSKGEFSHWQCVILNGNLGRQPFSSALFIFKSNASRW